MIKFVAKHWRENGLNAEQVIVDVCVAAENTDPETLGEFNTLAECKHLISSDVTMWAGKYSVDQTWIEELELDDDGEYVATNNTYSAPVRFKICVRGRRFEELAVKEVELGSWGAESYAEIMELGRELLDETEDEDATVDITQI